MEGALLHDSGRSLPFLVSAFFQRARQFLPGGALLFGSASTLGGSFLPGSALLLTLGVTFVLLACALFSRAFAL